MADIRHKELLQEIRQQHEHRNDFDDRLAEIAAGSVRSAQGSTQRDPGTDEEPRRTAETASRIVQRSDQQPGGNDGSNIDEPQGSDSDSKKTRRNRPLTPAEKAAEEDRQRELARARQRRYEERKKKESEIEQEQTAFSGNSELNTPSERHRHSQVVPDGEPKKRGFFSDATKKDDVEIKVKKSKKDYSDVKLITNSEAVEKREKLIDLFVRGSAMIDQALQIFVKGHEEVHIWELSDFEAGLLADMQLEKAKKDKAAAAAVQQLLDMHERMFMFSIIGGRAVATGVHVVSHKGFGFR